jgi:hypothetical protein
MATNGDRDHDRDRPGDGGEDTASERKERILHTRISESLEQELKQRARGLGMSVSTVVRHVLLNTFGLVEDIVTDSTNLALAVTGQAVSSPPRRRPPAGRADSADSEILGWQEAVLNLNAVCGRCNDVLLRGTRAALAIRETPGPRASLCLRCLAALEVDARANDPRESPQAQPGTTDPNQGPRNREVPG